MTNNYSSDEINLFTSLFKGRNDIFAIRWEKEPKSGYMPAYFYDPFRYRMHKMKGGTFENYSEKSYLPLTNEQITNGLTKSALSSEAWDTKTSYIFSLA